jgi:hypothetical protein
VTGWVILLATGGTGEATHAYGPVEDEALARQFAAFLTGEVDPATCLRLVTPLDELLGWWRNNRQPADTHVRPIGWPPKPGEIWEDRAGDRWICLRHHTNPAAGSYLTCVARQADDNAEEIWRLFGPLHHVQFVAPTTGEEPPF